MTDNKIITAGIIIIGNEILSGRVQDVNVQHIAKKLNKLGVHLKEVRVIPDVESVIVDTTRHFHTSFDYVFTTGGIGPTHDDITAVSMAKAFSREVEFNEKALEILKSRYGGEHLTEGRKNMARMPKGIELIKNPVTSAPGFQIENIFVMAGVPEIMQGMLDFALEKIIPGDPIISSTIHCHLPEGDLARGMRDIQNQNTNIDIGSYPFWKMGLFGTSVVIRGQDRETIAKTTDQIKELITSLGGEPVVEVL
jgi:molybdenum cofactor synthesis domain-containing protein